MGLITRETARLGLDRISLPLSLSTLTFRVADDFQKMTWGGEIAKHFFDSNTKSNNNIITEGTSCIRPNPLTESKVRSVVIMYSAHVMSVFVET